MRILRNSVLVIGLVSLFGLGFTPSVSAQVLEEPENGGQVINETNTITPKTPEEFDEQQAEVLGTNTLAETGDYTAPVAIIGAIISLGAAVVAKRTYAAYKYLP